VNALYRLALRYPGAAVAAVPILGLLLWWAIFEIVWALWGFPALMGAL
jgi:hypothetical protein